MSEIRRHERIEASPGLARAMTSLQQLYISPAFKSFIQTQIHVSQIATALAHQMSPLMEMVQRAVAQMQPFLKLSLALAERARQREHTLSAFRDVSLWPAPSMSPELVAGLVRLHAEGKGRLIPARVTQHYKRQGWNTLGNAVSSWKVNSLLQPRMHIIEEALWTHKSGKYSITVPALLPQIEGVARELCVQYKLKTAEAPLAFKCGGKKTHLTTVFENVAANWVTLEREIAIYGLLYYLEGALYLSTDFEHDFERVKLVRRRRALNRHAILHGIQLNYNTPLNSLRCFLALDVLALLGDSD